MWLRTLACEGGLPLELLRRNNERLTRFFAAILEQCLRQQANDASAAEQIAIEEKDNLSAIFHQPEIFRLTGILLAAIIHLQGQLGEIDDATDVMALLEQKTPDWKNHLPLRVDDDTVKKLLTYLMRQSSRLVQTLSRERLSLLRWHGRLKTDADGWQLEKWLDMPGTPKVEQIAQWLDQAKEEIVAARWVLCLNGREMAWLSRQADRNGDEYRLEYLQRTRALLLTDEALVAPHRLTLYDPVTHKEYPVRTHNGEPWNGDLPWVFSSQNHSQTKEWLTEGSACVQNGQAWVVVASDMVPLTNQGCRLVGTLPALDRSVYEVVTASQFATAAGDLYRIDCHAAKDSQEIFSMADNALLPGLLQDPNQPVYQGIPRITISRGAWSTNKQGQWRPAGDGGSWRSSDQTEGAHGLLWVGLVEDGATRFRRKVRVVPEDFHLVRTVGEGRRAGLYRLEGLHGNRLEVLTPRARVVEQTENSATIACTLHHGTPLPKLEIALFGLTLQLPWPQRGAAFELAGQLLAHNDLVPVTRLGGLKLKLYGVQPGERIWLNGRLGQLSFDESLQAQAEEDELNLRGLEERIHALLVSSDLDDRVKLTVEPSSGQRWATVEIGHFDLHVARQSDLLWLQKEITDRLGAGWEHRVRMEMIPLWRPDDLPRQLPRVLNEEGSVAWLIPTKLAPGPWWIVGREGDWARFRPLLHTVGGVVQSSRDERLEDAIREADPELRVARIHTLLSAMGNDSDHPDWELLVAIIRLTREFPPNTLDVVKLLVRHPQTLQMALLRPETPDNPSFGLIWQLAGRLPFSWSLQSVQSWHQVAKNYFRALHNKMILYDPAETFHHFQRFRHRATNQRAYWSVLCDWLQERLFPEHPVAADSALQLARNNTGWIDFFLREAQQQLDKKYGADGRIWPQSALLDALLPGRSVTHDTDSPSDGEQGGQEEATRQYVPVRRGADDAANAVIRSMMNRYEEWSDRSAVYNLPRIVAKISTQPEMSHFQENEMWIYQMRLIRYFDSDYFDYVHSLELTRELARMRREKQP
ncbi:MAG: hypothetical protein HQM06_17175 [Magnetococcales bacterium]|nr:hypothetical protein [Magnetococcales bacterium]